MTRTSLGVAAVLAIALLAALSAPQQAMALARKPMDVQVTSQQQKAREPLVVSLGSALECDLCKFVAMEAETLFQSNASEQEIMASLDRACSVLISTVLVAECKALVLQVAPLMIQALVNEENPSVICNQLSFCTTVDVPQLRKDFKRVGDAVDCEICEWLVGRLEAMVEKDNLKDLDYACQVFTSTPMVTECQTLVNQYAPEIVQLLINQENPTVVCSQLSLCPAPKVQGDTNVVPRVGDRL